MDYQWFLIYFVLSLNIFGQLAAMPVEEDDDGGRIVGGEDADIAEAPYQLSVKMQGSHLCGASIVGEYWAVSAAHCFESGSYGITVVSGTSYHRRGGNEHQVERIVNHPRYQAGRSMDYDIAVIKVKNPFKLGSRGVNCIRLASRQPSPGTLAMATGWGALSEQGYQPEILQKVSVPVVSNQECNQSYGTITNNMVCAGYKEGGKDSCQGDSGGPLAANRELIGVVSFGKGCAQPDYYGVYANVNQLRSWVEGITGPLRC